MDTLKKIEKELNKFIRKHYLNKLIKGVLLFILISTSYILIITMIENNLWLSDRGRFILFYSLLLIMFLCFFKYIVLNVLSLFSLAKKMTFEEASTIIGLKMHDVDDKLLNLIQLSKIENKSDLLSASIEQRSIEMNNFRFTKVINLRNTMLLSKYLLIPFFIVLTLVFTKKFYRYYDSLERITNYKAEYIEPAPFDFVVLNKIFEVTEGEPYTLKVKLEGDDILDELSVVHNNDKTFFAILNKEGLFEYTFTNTKKDIHFFLKSGKFKSQLYNIKIKNIPTINDILIIADYPDYINTKKDTISNIFDISVPRGTLMSWQIKTRWTTSVDIKYNDSLIQLKSKNDIFKVSQQVLRNSSVELSASNNNFEKKETLTYNIKSILDQSPMIKVLRRKDSLFVDKQHHYGILSDDYGISKLEIVYYDRAKPSKVYKHQLKVQSAPRQEFYYTFPDDLYLEESEKYTYFFKVYDNDNFPKPKSSRSKSFQYDAMSKEQIKKEYLFKEKMSLQGLDNLMKDYDDKKNAAFFIKNKTNYKSSKFETFLKKELQQQKMMKKFAEDLRLQQTQISGDKKTELKSRLQKEEKQAEKRKELLQKIKELSKKTDSNIKNELKTLKKENKTAKRNLSQILELTKRSYLNKKLDFIAEKIMKLSNDIINSKNQNVINQENYKTDFESIKKDIADAEAFNETLKKEKNIRRDYSLEKNIKKDFEDAQSYIEQEKKTIAKDINNSAAIKLKKMANNLKEERNHQKQMQLKMDIAAVRQIMDNIIAFSFNQENLLISTEKLNPENDDFSNMLKKQYELKQVFQHVDDSIYTLSLSQPMITEKINKQIEEVHYYMEKTLENLSEKQNYNAGSNQKFILYNVNDLGAFLSDILDNLVLDMSQKKGDKKEFQLPDIIQKQKELIDELKAKEKRQNSQNKQQLSKEQVEVYKQQQEIKRMIEKLMDKMKKEGKSQVNVSKDMKKAEKELLEKGFTAQFKKQLTLIYEKLLEYKNANYTKGQENRRESKTNERSYKNKNTALEYFKDARENKDILWRESLPVNKSYKPVINNYFNE